MPQEARGVVAAVHISPTHTMAKPSRSAINLLTGLGAEGDAHCGATIKHRSRVRKNPDQPNLRQVHLIQRELFDELANKGFNVQPGQMGENITTRELSLLTLPAGTLLHIGEEAVVALTGLRNPCAQLDGVIPGLMEALLDRDGSGALIRKAGVMAVVIASRVVRPGDAIRAVVPDRAHKPLEVV